MLLFTINTSTYVEFDIWYNETYVNENNTGGVGDFASSSKIKSDYLVLDDAAERFERMQKELLLTDLDSMPFRQAQMKTNRRVNSNLIFILQSIPIFSFSMYLMQQLHKDHGNKPQLQQ